MEEDIGIGGWNPNHRRSSSARKEDSGNGALVKAIASAVLLIGGVFASDRLTRTPIDYHGVPYLGYHVDKTEGKYFPVFGVMKEGWEPGSIARPLCQEDVPFRNDDKKFDCDDAFHRTGSHASDSGLYDVHGYHGWLSGDVATNISPTVGSKIEQ